MEQAVKMKVNECEKQKSARNFTTKHFIIRNLVFKLKLYTFALTDYHQLDDDHSN